MLRFVALLLLFVSVVIANPLPFFLHLNVTSLEPCADFHGYVCDAWALGNAKPSNEPVWSPWVAATHQINKKLTKLLKSAASHEDEGLRQAQIFYKHCVKLSSHLGELKSLIGSLGGWPLLNSSWEASDFDWLKEIASITRLVAIHPMVKLKIDIDYVNPKEYMLYIEPGDLIFPSHILLQPQKYQTELAAYEAWIRETLQLFDDNSSVNEREIKELIKFEIHLAGLIEAKHQKTARLTVSQLAKKVPASWLASLQIFLQDFHQLAGDTVVTVRHYMYLKNVHYFVKKTNPRTVANYLIWSVVKDLARDTTQQMRNLNFQINRAVFGITKDFSREFECVSKSIEHFSPVLVQSYAELLDPEIDLMIYKMFASIQKELIERVKQSALLTREGIELIVEKVENIQIFLKFPSWYANEELTERYRIIHMTDNHFVNVFLLKTFKMAEELKKYGNLVENVEWPSSPFEVNAFYSILQNAIFIPLGMMQPPFFDAKQSASRNFGALGALIGHELTHAIDPMGILADKTGKVTQWLPGKDRDALKNATKCYGEHFQSVGERIADETGVGISLKALSLHEAKDYREFFQSFAGMWCEMKENAELFDEDEHGTVSERVPMALKNNKEFHTAFGCDVKDDVENDCKLW